MFSLVVKRAFFFFSLSGMISGGWQNIPADILRCILELLSNGSVVVCSHVCTSWRKIASSDQVWSPRLCKLIGSTPERFQVRCRMMQGFGALSMMNIVRFACYDESERRAANGTKRVDIRWFENCPLHPLRHGTLRPRGLFAFLKCMITHHRAFMSMAGVTPIALKYETPSSVARSPLLRHRRLRYGQTFDRSTRIIYFMSELLALFASLGTSYAYVRLSSKIHILFHPFLLVVPMFPWGVFASLLLNHMINYTGHYLDVLPTLSLHAFAILFCTYNSFRLLLFEHFLPRLALLIASSIAIAIDGVLISYGNQLCFFLVSAALWRLSIPFFSFFAGVHITWSICRSYKAAKLID